MPNRLVLYLHVWICLVKGHTSSVFIKPSTQCLDVLKFKTYMLHYFILLWIISYIFFTNYVLYALIYFVIIEFC